MAKKKSKKTAKKAVKKVLKKTAKKSLKTKTRKVLVKKRKPAKKKAVKPLKKTIKKAAKKVVKKVAKKIVKKGGKKKLVKKVSPVKKKKTTVTPKTSTKQAIKTEKFVPHSTHLRAGDFAPWFEGKDQHGNIVSLSTLAGKNIILYFYPKDDTPGCTAEACSLRDEYRYLTDKNYAVVGVSADNEKSHARFAGKYQLPFPLLADTDRKIIKAFNVFGKKTFMGKVFDGIIRTTFIIDADGVIQHVLKEVNTKEHAKQIMDLN